MSFNLKEGVKFVYNITNENVKTQNIKITGGELVKIANSKFYYNNIECRVVTKSNISSEHKKWGQFTVKYFLN